MSLGKQAISFGMGAVPAGLGEGGWLRDGDCGDLCGGCCWSTTLQLVTFMVCGKGIRRWMAGSWIARVHGKRAVAGGDALIIVSFACSFEMLRGVTCLKEFFFVRL